MHAQPFLQLVLDQLERDAPAELRPWQARVRHGMLQIHYGNPRVHYELWLQSRTQRAEVGLHFEDEPEVNRRWGALYAERVFELQAALGPTVELEEWTAAWMRLHLTLPMAPLEPPFAGELATVFGALIAVTAADVRRGSLRAAASRR